MSSMHMNTTIGLRRMRTPMAPTVKRNADNPSRYGNRFGFSIRVALSLTRAPGQVDSADGRNQQEHRGDLEWQEVVGEQLSGDRLHVAGIVHRVRREAERVIRIAWAAQRDGVVFSGVVGRSV